MAFQFDYDYEWAMENVGAYPYDYLSYMHENFDINPMPMVTEENYQDLSMIPSLVRDPNYPQIVINDSFERSVPSFSPNSSISEQFDFHMQTNIDSDKDIKPSCYLSDKQEHGGGPIPVSQPRASAAALGFKCKFCPKRFVQNKERDEHMDKCRLDRSHECSHCSRRFKNRAGLQQHQKIHAKDRSFQCHFCPKKFTQKSHLDQHERIHTGAKPYACHICGKAFRQRGQQMGHESQIHGVKKIDPNTPYQASQTDSLNLY